MTLRRSLFAFGLLATTGGAVAILACGASDFDAQSKVTSVRIFGTRVDTPYTNPGDTATLEILMTDGRKVKPRPLKNFWIPVVCMNPSQDLYYLCFLAEQPGVDAGASIRAPFADGGGGALSDAGGPGAFVGGNPLSSIPTGIDLGPFLPQGTTFSFQMPVDAIQPRLGTPPYGLALVFNIACAGEVRLAERSGNNPQQVPIQCTDENGVQLSPSDYVIGINRVYSYGNQTNANPVVQNVLLNSVPVDPNVGLVVDHCVASKRADCPAIKIGVTVPDSSWEVNPEETGGETHEQIWVTYYSDIGDFKDDARLLFDTTKGRVSDSDIEFRAPYELTDGTMWAVVHDNRAGAAFIVMPIHVK